MSRSTFITAARSLIGIQGSPLAAALLPTAAPAVQAGVDTLSTCELAAAAVIRIACALPDPAPYVPGGDHAAKALYQLADPDSGGTPWHPAGALRAATLEAPPDVGDAIWFGPAPGGHPPEHVDAAVVEIEDARREHEADEYATEIHLRAIAGGQPNGSGHNSAIAEVERVLVWMGGRWACRATGRPVWVIVDAGKVEERYGARGGASGSGPPRPSRRCGTLCSSPRSA